MEKKYALLIDAENISYSYIEEIVDIVSNYGLATIKRIYGDFTKPTLKGWMNELLKYSLTPILNIAYTQGKNSTDSAMIINAMEIMYTSDVDGFCIVSSDSDFTGLASKIRESGKDVLGIGLKHTPMSFTKACTKFVYLVSQEEISKSTTKKNDTLEHSSITPKDVVIDKINKIIEENADDEGWVLSALIGSQITKYVTDFSPKNYGKKKLNDLLEEWGYEMHKEMDTNSNTPNSYNMFVRIKITSKKKKK